MRYKESLQYRDLFKQRQHALEILEGGGEVL